MDTQTTTPTADLHAFVAAAKSRGVSDTALVPLLRQRGWNERRIYDALTPYYTDVIGVAPPARGGGMESARDAFLYLLNFITLASWAIALGQIFYDLIDRRFPDAVYGYAYASRSGLLAEISWQLATVLIAFPAFLFVARAIARIRKRGESSGSGVRSWITYVALVVAAMVCLGDGVWFTQALLRGEVTLRFVLDTLVLATLGGGIFTYYLVDLRAAGAAR